MLPSSVLQTAGMNMGIVSRMIDTPRPTFCTPCIYCGDFAAKIILDSNADRAVAPSRHPKPLAVMQLFLR